MKVVWSKLSTVLVIYPFSGKLFVFKPFLFSTNFLFENTSRKNQDIKKYHLAVYQSMNARLLQNASVSRNTARKVENKFKTL